MKEITCAYASDTGRAREHNEDSYLADTANGFFAVADGMGGHEGGEVASAIVIDSIKESLSKGIPMQDVLCRAHSNVLEAGKNGHGQVGMGSTAVVLKLDGADYRLAWVGDSRAYLWDGGLTQLTRDHSYVQRMIDAGVLTDAEARQHPQRSVITQVLGSEEISEVKPDEVYGRLYHGQKILLCSDGLTSELEDNVIADILGQGQSDQETVVALIQAANDHGGEDNITVILVSSPLDDHTPTRQGGTRPIDTRRLNKSSKSLSGLSPKRRILLIALILLIIGLGAYGTYLFLTSNTPLPALVPDNSMRETDQNVEINQPVDSQLPKEELEHNVLPPKLQDHTQQISDNIMQEQQADLTGVQIKESENEKSPINNATLETEGE